MTQSSVQLLNDQSMTTSSKGSSRFPICCRHIGKREDPGDNSPKAFPACYSTQLGPILSQVINNFAFVVSFSTFSAQPGCLFDHLRIYRKIPRKWAQVGLTAQIGLLFQYQMKCYFSCSIYFKYIRKVVLN